MMNQLRTMALGNVAVTGIATKEKYLKYLRYFPAEAMLVPAAGDLWMLRKVHEASRKLSPK
jgi:hypothetical protein